MLVWGVDVELGIFGLDDFVDHNEGEAKGEGGEEEDEEVFFVEGVG